MEYLIDCTGDCCVGDFVRFERAVFVGKYPKARFSHNEIITGEIIRDSYGKDKQQHTFTIVDSTGLEFRIKGRNLYRNSVYRRKWENEENRVKALQEKHERGAVARNKRSIRKSTL